MPHSRRKRPTITVSDHSIFPQPPEISPFEFVPVSRGAVRNLFEKNLLPATDDTTQREAGEAAAEVAIAYLG